MYAIRSYYGTHASQDEERRAETAHGRERIDLGVAHGGEGYDHHVETVEQVPALVV